MGEDKRSITICGDIKLFKEMEDQRRKFEYDGYKVYCMSIEYPAGSDNPGAVRELYNYIAMSDEILLVTDEDYTIGKIRDKSNRFYNNDFVAEQYIYAANLGKEIDWYKKPKDFRTVNLGYSIYTYKHQIAFRYTIDNLEIELNDIVGLYTLLRSRAYLHDMDKLVMYQFMKKSLASVKHRLYSRHHLCNDIPKQYIDYVEAIIDFESAGYTKPDKPLNAFDTLYAYYPDEIDIILPILTSLGLDSSYKVNKEEFDKIITPDIIPYSTNINGLTCITPKTIDNRIMEFTLRTNIKLINSNRPIEYDILNLTKIDF